jgi:hypothetical protein
VYVCTGTVGLHDDKIRKDQIKENKDNLAASSGKLTNDNKEIAYKFISFIVPISKSFFRRRNYFTSKKNNSIFKKIINYKYLYQRMNVIREELLMTCMHPGRLERWINMSGDRQDENIFIIRWWNSFINPK